MPAFGLPTWLGLFPPLLSSRMTPGSSLLVLVPHAALVYLHFPIPQSRKHLIFQANTQQNSNIYLHCKKRFPFSPSRTRCCSFRIRQSAWFTCPLSPCGLRNSLSPPFHIILYSSFRKLTPSNLSQLKATLVTTWNMLRSISERKLLIMCMLKSKPTSVTQEHQDSILKMHLQHTSPIVALNQPIPLLNNSYRWILKPRILGLPNRYRAQLFPSGSRPTCHPMVVLCTQAFPRFLLRAAALPLSFAKSTRLFLKGHWLPVQPCTA